jgi:hypothetical protein
VQGVTSNHWYRDHYDIVAQGGYTEGVRPFVTMYEGTMFTAMYLPAVNEPPDVIIREVNRLWAVLMCKYASDPLV